MARPRPRGVETDETLEDPKLGARGRPRAVVSQAQADLVRRGGDRQLGARAARRVRDQVVQQVCDGLLQQHEVTPHPALGEVQIARDPRLRQRRLIGLGDALGCTQLSFVAAYTYSDGEFLDNVSGTVRAGNRLPNMPKHSASLWSRYDVNEKLGVALGVIAQGKRYAATDNLVAMPGYTRVDAAIYYDINDQFTAQVNVENLLDKRYWSYAHTNDNMTPGSPTAVKVGLTARF